MSSDSLSNPPSSAKGTAQEDRLFAAALERPAEERAAFLEAACGSDPDLRARLDALLAAHQEPNALLDTETPTHLAEPMCPGEFAGQVIGRYKLLENLGEGGFGSVWAAEQREPVKRRVALKVIKLGMDTKQVVARFEAERQALALMDHPNIAKVLDAGTTETGRPFFVMELVKGIPITRYCEQQKLAIQERLDLFIKVCRAIQHAHQKGIVHRDIKPNNILVTLHDGVPVPKVIDFGIAKATQQELTELTIYTQHHQFIGTPAYMSPEQAELSGLDIDTRSDIYSLGVLLYELLTGSTPFDSKELLLSGIDEMRKIIREREPIKPSTRLSRTRSAPPNQATSWPPHHGSLPSDLDWIVMKCLEKDRTRRYDTANGLAADLQRHLANEPVIARPPSAAYKLQKAWRRNRMLYGAALTVVTALWIGVGISLWQAKEARDAQAVAERARSEAEGERAKAVAQAHRANMEEQRALAGERRAREQAYAADMNLAMQAAEARNIGRVRRLLSRHWPNEGQADLRDWEWLYLWQLSQSDEIAAFLGLTSGAIYDLAVSPNGRLLASSSERKDLRIQDVMAGETLQLGEMDSWISGLDFNESGEELALACWDGRIRFIHPLSGTEARPPILLEGRAGAIAYAPADRYLAATTGAELIIWERTPTGFQVYGRLPSPRPFGSSGRGLAFSPDGHWVAVTQQSGCSLVDLRGDAPKETQLATEATIELAFSPDSNHVALVGWSGDVELLEQKDGQWKKGRSWKAHPVWISGVAFTPDNERLVTASADQLVKTWDWRSGEELAVLQGHRDEISSVALAPDGGSLYTGSKDGEVKRFALGRPLRTHFIEKSLPPVRRARFSANQEYLGVLTHDAQVLVFRSSTLEQVMEHRVGVGVASLAVGNEGEEVVVGDQDGLIQRIRSRATEPAEPILRHEGPVVALCFSPDGRQLATASADRTVRLFDFSNRKESVLIREMDVEGPEFYTLAFSQDGTRLAVADWAGAVDIREVRTGERLLQTPPHADGVWQQLFIQGDERMACASSSGYLTLWNLDPLEKLGSVKGQLLGLHALSVSGNGRRLAVGTSEGTVKLWSSDLAYEIFTLKTGREGFQTLAFLPDGKSIVAVNADSIFLWRAPLLEEIPRAEESLADP